MRIKRKKLLLKILIPVGVLAVIVAAVAFYVNPYRGTTSMDKLSATLPARQAVSRQDALKDLDYLASMIHSKHLSAAHGLPEAVRAQYEKEKEGLPAEPTVLDVWQASSRILKLLNDAHSSVSYYSSQASATRLGQRFLKTDEGVVCTDDPYKGKRLTKIGGVAVDELYGRFLSMYSYENTEWADRSFPNYLRSPAGLAWLGVEAGDEIQAEFDADGKTETVSLPFTAPPSASGAEAPDFVRYEIDRGRSLGILTLDECNLNDRYRDTVKRFFTEVKAAGIRNVAVDLRQNGGGNSGVTNEFLRYLPIDSYKDYGARMRLGPLVVGSDPSDTKNDRYTDLTFGGNVYLLTSRDTFSSAMWFATVLRDNGLCGVIGQPPGNKPSSYGDVLLFQMPNTKLAFTLTYKQFTRPDTSKDEEPKLLPDYPTELTAEGDGVMEKLYEVIR